MPANTQGAGMREAQHSSKIARKAYEQEPYKAWVLVSTFAHPNPSLMAGLAVEVTRKKRCSLQLD